MGSNDYKPGERITLVCLAGNLCLSIFKLFAGLTGGSKAMVADAVHSTSDLIATAVVYIGIKIAQKPVDPEHPYGHGKAEPLAAAFVGLTLVFAAAAILKNIVESIYFASFATPSLIALIAAATSIAAKETMFRVTLAAGKNIGSEAIMANAWDHRSDAYSSVGTLIGIAGSMLGSRFNIHFLTYLDPVAGAVVACMIFKVAYDILKQSVYSLMDSAPEKGRMQGIEQTVKAISGVLAITWIKARYIGRHLLVDMAVAVDSALSVEEGHQIAVAIRDSIMKNDSEILDVLVHIDPFAD